jgi:predicted nucleotide-binding protein
VQSNIEDVADVMPWEQSFSPSSIVLPELLKIAGQADFGIFIFTPDDAMKMKGGNVKSVRDNVIFEAGLFAGALGRERCLIIVPKGQEDLRIPTDLDGLTLLKFKSSQANTRAALGPACNDIKKAILKLGFRKRDLVKNISRKVSHRTDRKSKKITIPRKIRKLALSF